MIARRVAHLRTPERRARATNTGDGEGILGGRAQDSTEAAEDFEGLATRVDDGGNDLEVRQSIDIDIGGRGLDVQAGGSRGGDRIGGDDSDDSTEGRSEHYDSGGGRRGDSNEASSFTSQG